MNDQEKENEPHLSLVKQLAVLKRLHPPLGDIPNFQLLNEFKNKDEWVLGGLLAEEAETLIRSAQENGIRIELEKKDIHMRIKLSNKELLDPMHLPAIAFF